MTDPTAPASHVDPADANGDDSFIKVPAAMAAPAPMAVAAAASPAEPVAQSAPGQEPPSEDEYDRAIGLLNEHVEQAKARLRDAQNHLKDAETERDQVLSEKAALFPPMTHAQSVKAHLAREAQRREARVNAANAVNNAVGQTVVSPKASVLDASIAGRRRGQVPLIVSTTPAQS